MKCPYDNKKCNGVESSEMHLIGCKNCKRYRYGVRLTGGIFTWDLFEKWKRKK